MTLFPYTSNDLFILYENGNSVLFSQLPLIYMGIIGATIVTWLIIFLLEKKKLQFIVINVISLIIFYLIGTGPYFLNNIATYIKAGNYLRDVQGINIFSGDYSSWIISMAPVDVFIIFLIIYVTWKLSPNISKRIQKLSPDMPRRK